jgi:hypothetical protein
VRPARIGPGVAAVMLLSLFGAARAQTQTPASGSGDYVTREEYDKLVRRLDQVTHELESMKADRSASSQPAANGNAATTQDLEEVDKTVRQVQQDVLSLRSGTTKMLLTGYAFAGFEDHQHSNSTFSAGFNPVFLWELNNRLFFEGELEIGLETGDEGSETATDLELADMSYILNDHVTVGGGLFKTPLGIFNERLEEKWINKMPDRPLPYDDELGIAQEASLGAFARGGFAWGSTKWNYAAYVSNGPNVDPATGQFDFDNFVDANDNKAVGGRIGFQPIPALELGYSIQFADIQPDGSGSDIRALTQAADVSYVRTIDQIKGKVDFRAEWVFFNADGDLPNRNAGYVQLAYRPTQVQNPILKNLEFVGRYDRLNVPDSAVFAPGHEQRFEIGLDYWITPSFVVKTAYEFDDKSVGENDNAFFIQATVGL